MLLILQKICVYLCLAGLAYMVIWCFTDEGSKGAFVLLLLVGAGLFSAPFGGGARRRAPSIYDDGSSWFPTASQRIYDPRYDAHPENVHHRRC